MLKTCPLNNNKVFYYDLENKTIARFPTSSNLLLKGSDNSLYFGMKQSENVSSIFCSFFNKKTIDDINGLKYVMNCGNDTVDVVININAEGQIQIKICKDGTMGKLTDNYSFNKMEKYNFNEMLLVLDFVNNEIRFKDPKELCL